MILFNLKSFNNMLITDQSNRLITIRHSGQYQIFVKTSKGDIQIVISESVTEEIIMDSEKGAFLAQILQ